MSQIRIYSIETPLLGVFGFAITAADLSNIHHFKGESFVVISEFFRAFSFRFDNDSIKAAGMGLSEEDVLAEALQQVKNDFAEYMASIEPGSPRTLVLESVSIVPSETHLLIQHCLRGGRQQLEDIRHKTSVEKLRGLIDPIIDIHPMQRHEL
jgi:hypothetical protein